MGSGCIYGLGCRASVSLIGGMRGIGFRVQGVGLWARRIGWDLGGGGEPFKVTHLWGGLGGLPRNSPQTRLRNVGGFHIGMHWVYRALVNEVLL